jgi:hypothetical protein
VTTYSEWTQQLGDAWVAALKRAEDTLVSVSSTVRESTAKMDLPAVEVPEQITKLNEAVSEKLPKPSEIVEANFELTNRLLAAQRELTLKLIEAGTPAAAK